MLALGDMKLWWREALVCGGAVSGVGALWWLGVPVHWPAMPLVFLVRLWLRLTALLHWALAALACGACGGVMAWLLAPAWHLVCWVCTPVWYVLGWAAYLLCVLAVPVLPLGAASCAYVLRSLVWGRRKVIDALHGDEDALVELAEGLINDCTWAWGCVNVSVRVQPAVLKPARLAAAACVLRVQRHGGLAAAYRADPSFFPLQGVLRDGELPADWWHSDEVHARRVRLGTLRPLDREWEGWLGRLRREIPLSTLEVLDGASEELRPLLEKFMGWALLFVAARNGSVRAQLAFARAMIACDCDREAGNHGHALAFARAAAERAAEPAARSEAFALIGTLLYRGLGRVQMCTEEGALRAFRVALDDDEPLALWWLGCLAVCGELGVRTHQPIGVALITRAARVHGVAGAWFSLSSCVAQGVDRGGARGRTLRAWACYLRGLRFFETHYRRCLLFTRNSSRLRARWPSGPLREAGCWEGRHYAALLREDPCAYAGQSASAINLVLPPQLAHGGARAPDSGEGTVLRALAERLHPTLSAAASDCERQVLDELWPLLALHPPLPAPRAASSRAAPGGQSRAGGTAERARRIQRGAQLTEAAAAVGAARATAVATTAAPSEPSAAVAAGGDGETMRVGDSDAARQQLGLAYQAAAAVWLEQFTAANGLEHTPLAQRLRAQRSAAERAAAEASAAERAAAERAQDDERAAAERRDRPIPVSAPTRAGEAVGQLGAQGDEPSPAQPGARGSESAQPRARARGNSVDGSRTAAAAAAEGSPGDAVEVPAVAAAPARPARRQARGRHAQGATAAASAASQGPAARAGQASVPAAAAAAEARSACGAAADAVAPASASSPAPPAAAPIPAAAAPAAAAPGSAAAAWADQAAIAAWWSEMATRAQAEVGRGPRATARNDAAAAAAVRGGDDGRSSGETPRRGLVPTTGAGEEAPAVPAAAAAGPTAAAAPTAAMTAETLPLSPPLPPPRTTTDLAGPAPSVAAAARTAFAASARSLPPAPAATPVAAAAGPAGPAAAAPAAPRAQQRACTHCGAVNVRLKRCAGCEVARFCGRECMVAGWPAHKAECERVRGMRRSGAAGAAS